MKQLLLSAFVCAVFFQIGTSQVTVSPVFPTVEDDVIVTYDATKGNGALAGVSPVYIHTGLITENSQTPSDWKYTATSWGVANSQSTMNNIAPNIWQKQYNIRDFYGVPMNEEVLKLAFVFRNSNGSIVGRAFDGSDMFYDVVPDDAPLQTRFSQPSQDILFTDLGETIQVNGAASKTSDITLYDNGVLVKSATGKSILASITAGDGAHTVELIAYDGQDSSRSTFQYLTTETPPPADPPTGTVQGIQYLDDTSVRLSIFAPNKSKAFVIGDFNDWSIDPAYQMRESLDGNLWWVDITGLQPGQYYSFQYLIDGIKVADPLSTLVLDENNDPFIPDVTFPNLPPFPTGKTTGIVSLLQTAQQPFNWTATNYQRPEKEKLIVYELLVRDFIQRHDYQTLIDTLDYLERLGVNAIELMPVNEFDGNISWGYNPSFHMALDKYYGTPESLKAFIDECHNRDMAVIIDVVYNHATGNSPHARLYWDAANNRPDANSPFLNPIPKHEFNVFNDYNHESEGTKSYTKISLQYWLEEFKVDGFRFDLSKGLTQKNTLGDLGAWGQFDASRVAILEDYADHVWSVDPGAYVILEHFADNSEEKVLAEYGMMLWGNMWGAYKDTGLGNGFGSNTNMSDVDYKERDWSVPHLIGFMESHDEDRIVYECLTYGNSDNPDHDVTSFPVAMRRKEMLQNLLYTVPGPKMMWQFGEVGYDFPINYCENGTIDQGCRTAPKPIRWDFYDDPFRRRLYDVTAALLHLRNTWEVFNTDDYTANISSGKIRTIFLNDDALDQQVFVLVNAGTTPTTTFQANFPPGIWYEYYTGDTLTVVQGPPLFFDLEPAEYRIYTNKKVDLPDGLNPTPTIEASGPVDAVTVFPNPASGTVYADVYLNASARVNLSVVNALGQRIYEQNMDGALPGINRFALPGAQWTPGIYYLNVGTQNGGLITKKLVIR
jgi:hypothetical protein